MSKLKCFLCGARYSPQNRETVAYLGTPESEEATGVVMLSIRQKVLRLCPACVKAAAFGIALDELSNENGIRWLGDIEYEGDDDA